MNKFKWREKACPQCATQRAKKEDEMLSVLEVKRKLPKLFIEKLYENYGVKSSSELSEEQLKDAIRILKTKLIKKGE